MFFKCFSPVKKVILWRLCNKSLVFLRSVPSPASRETLPHFLLSPSHIFHQLSLKCNLSFLVSRLFLTFFFTESKIYTINQRTFQQRLRHLPSFIAQMLCLARCICLGIQVLLPGLGGIHLPAGVSTALDTSW